MIELKRCPFCGGEGEVHEYNSFWYKAGCNNNKCFLYITAQVFNSKEEAIKAWNTRKPLERIVERLEEAKFPQKFGGKTEMMILADKAIEIVKEEGGMNG